MARTHSAYITDNMACGNDLSTMIRNLHEAVFLRDLDRLVSLRSLLSGSKQHWTSFPARRTGDSLLHVAVREGHMSVVRYLCEDWIDGVVNLEISNSVGKKALHIAAQKSNEFIAEYLLRKGAEPDSLKSNDWTPLMTAATKKGPMSLATIKMLIRYGSNPLLQNKDGWTALHIACREGDVRIVHELINHGIEAITTRSYNGRNALHVAALHGHTDIVERLLQENSCPKDPVDSCGFTPLMESVRGGHINVMRLLLDFKADLTKCDTIGRNCSHLAAETGHTDILQCLVPRLISNVDAPSTKGLTALHCAVRSGQTRSVRLLLDLGANPLLKDSQGRSALDFCYGSSPEIHDVVSSTIKRRPFTSY